MRKIDLPIEVEEQILKVIRNVITWENNVLFTSNGFANMKGRSNCGDKIKKILSENAITNNSFKLLTSEFDIFESRICNIDSSIEIEYDCTSIYMFKNNNSFLINVVYNWLKGNISVGKIKREIYE